jgi:hypothetical protein
MSSPPDHAAVATTAILQIVATAPKEEWRQAIENYLRDEFTDEARQSAADANDSLDDFLDKGETVAEAEAVAALFKGGADNK